MGKSENWKHWLTTKDAKVCELCNKYLGKIYAINDIVNPEPPLHPNCRCFIETMDTIIAGTATYKGKDGADYYVVHNNGDLPDYYITTNDAIKDYSYVRGKNTIGGKAPGKMIGGDVYKNENKHLPDAPGRTWKEADINYVSGPRNKERIVYSNDGLIFVTYDHYYTFFEVIKEADEEEE